MIDLAALFQEAETQHKEQSFPAFPTSDSPVSEKQTIDRKHISVNSDISGTVDRVNEPARIYAVQARASAGASRRARDACAEAPEMSELPEKVTPARRCISDLPSKKSEKQIEVGNRDRLPASVPVAVPAFEERAAFLEYECGLSHADAEAQAAAETGATTSGELALWRSALTAMSPDRIPCPGYRGDEWARALTRALDFLDRFGPQAEALGWTAPRLFGVHPVAGIVRVDCCGGLVLPSAGAVRAITATEISFGHLTHREKPGQPQGVPIWEFGR